MDLLQHHWLHHWEQRQLLVTSRLNFYDNPDVELWPKGHVNYMFLLYVHRQLSLLIFNILMISSETTVPIGTNLCQQWCLWDPRQNFLISSWSDHKHLGVTFSHNCKWHCHIQNILKSMSVKKILIYFKQTRHGNNLFYIYFASFRICV